MLVFLSGGFVKVCTSGDTNSVVELPAVTHRDAQHDVGRVISRPGVSHCRQRVAHSQTADQVFRGPAWYTSIGLREVSTS